MLPRTKSRASETRASQKRQQNQRPSGIAPLQGCRSTTQPAQLRRHNPAKLKAKCIGATKAPVWQLCTALRRYM
jgi:hypothetical protein